MVPRLWIIDSVKPFKSKNCHKIDLDATNPSLKKGSEIFERQSNLGEIQ